MLTVHWRLHLSSRIDDLDHVDESAVFDNSENLHEFLFNHDQRNAL
jgi:hypothetical protein